MAEPMAPKMRAKTIQTDCQFAVAQKAGEGRSESEEDLQLQTEPMFFKIDKGCLQVRRGV